MNNHIFQRLFYILLLSICIRQADAQQIQTLMIDGFDKEPPRVGSKYQRYVGTQGGYDIYYESAKARLSYVQISPRDTSNKALRVEFSLPPVFPWGNWLSVRREFQSPLNLNDYQGLELNLHVEAPSPNAFLRVTLSDLTDSGGFGFLQRFLGDEMWWFDCDPGLLKSKTQKWIQIRLPFNSFVPSYGDGTRHNDHRLNLKKIIAYEINLISESGEHPHGVVLLDSLRAYR